MQIKIYISFLITALFLCVPHTRAQEIEVPITLNEHGTQLRDVLRKIEQQSPYLFLYNETQLDMKQKINEKITSPDIRKILDRLCGPIGIRYEIMDVQILLMPKIDTGKPKPYPVPVTGYITDEKGSPMEFVSVIDLLSGKGGLTNEEGYFRFFTDKDSCRLQISHLAYLGGQYIVHSLMCAVADGEPVVTGIENVAALGTGRVVSGGIPAGHILHVSGDGHGLGGTGRKLGGLAVVQQLDGSLLNTVLLVIIGVGQADIELHNILAGHAAGVLDGHVRGDGLVFKVNIQVIEGLLKGGVAQTIAERIGNLIVIAPAAVCGRTDCRIGIALPHDGVKIAGLVVFVADVDVLGLDNGIVHADVGVGVGPLQITEILGAGGVGILDGIGIGQMTGGADRTGENVGRSTR